MEGRKEEGKRERGTDTFPPAAPVMLSPFDGAVSSAGRSDAMWNGPFPCSCNVCLAMPTKPNARHMMTNSRVFWRISSFGSSSEMRGAPHFTLSPRHYFRLIKRPFPAQIEMKQREKGEGVERGCSEREIGGWQGNGESPSCWPPSD